MKEVDKTAVLGRHVQVGLFCVIEEHVTLGDNVRIGNHVTIHKGTVIGPDTVVGCNAVLGKEATPAKTSTVQREKQPPLKIGARCIIGTGAVIYAGSLMGDDSMVADQAFVREKCRIGASVIIGRAVCLENQVTVGTGTKIQTGAYITAYTTIEEQVFIAPMVTTTNDNFMGRTKERLQLIKGPCIKRGARIGGGAVILPGITVGEEAFVAAGSLVTKNVEAGKVYMGTPARLIREVPPSQLLDTEDEK